MARSTISISVSDDPFRELGVSEPMTSIHTWELRAGVWASVTLPEKTPKLAESTSFQEQGWMEEQHVTSCMYLFLKVDINSVWVLYLNIDIGKIMLICNIYGINILILVVPGPCQAGTPIPFTCGSAPHFPSWKILGETWHKHLNGTSAVQSDVA